MSSRYTVKQGDYLAKIACDHGFADYMTLWKAPENADLRAKRKNPNVLFPGDVVVIPDREGRQEQGQTTTRHRFQLKTEDLKLRMLLEDAFQEPIRGAQCELRVEGKTVKLQTDDEGKLEHPISSKAQRADLVVREGDTRFKGEMLRLSIGGLDPVDKVAGQVERLMNLGYLTRAVDDPEGDVFLTALQEFQCDHELAIDGRCGPLTQKKLGQVHGC